MRTTDNVSKLISVVVIVLLFVAVFGFIFAFINNGQRNFCVTYGNEYIVGERKGFELPRDEYAVFHIGTITGQKVVYDATVTLLTDNIDDFEFAVDGEILSFREEFKDYNCDEFLHLSKTDSTIFIYVPSDLTFEKIVRAKYPGKDVAGVSEPVADKDIFALTITDSVEHTKTVIRFC